MLCTVPIYSYLALRKFASKENVAILWAVQGAADARLGSRAIKLVGFAAALEIALELVGIPDTRAGVARARQGSSGRGNGHQSQRKEEGLGQLHS